MTGFVNGRRPLRQRLLFAGASICAILVSSGAYAQDGASGDEADETIVVTGSRIPRAGFDTLQPATVITDEFLEQRAFVNVADALNQLPTFGLPGASNISDQSGANVGQNFVNFFGLGSQRTLTLVNGRRFVSSNPPTLFGDAAAGLQVDLNNIPIGMVQRIETVAVGGAPLYGADAIAGTVNIIMKDDFQGLQGSLQYGDSAQNDFASYRGSIVIGGNFADNRGNIVIGVDYSKEEGGLQASRSLGGSFQPTPDCEFARCYIPDARVQSISPGGIPSPDDFIANLDPIFDENGNPVAFAPDGTLRPFDFGDAAGAVFANGGDGVSLSGITSLKAPLERTVVSSFAHYDLTSNMRLFGEFFYAHGEAEEQANQPIFQSFFFGGTSGNLLFSTDNPFLTDQARHILEDVNGLSEFWLARSSSDLVGNAKESNEVSTYRLVGGLEGDFTLGSRDYKWDVSYNYGRSRGDSHGFDVDDRAFFLALDAVRDPSTGNIVCRAKLEGLPPLPGPNGFPDLAADNCAPLNLFGEGAPSPEAQAYVFRRPSSTAILTQQDFSGNISGALFALPAGNVEFATGFEYRKESGAFTVDPFSHTGLGRGAAIQDLSGKFSSTEAFAELSIPVISPENNLFIHEANIDASYRVIDNSRAGRDEAYTVGTRVYPIQDIELRGNFTRSVRAPAIVELFLPVSTTFDFANDPCDASLIGQNATRTANCTAELTALGVDPTTFQSNVLNASAQGRAGGNPNLANESADAWTAGVVLRPRFLRGFTAALDWVDIQLTNAIEQASLTNILEGCYDSSDFPNSSFCDNFTRDANGQIVDYLTTSANLGSEDFAGATFDATYTFDLTDLPFLKNVQADLGSLDLSANIFYLDRLDVSFSGTDLDVQKGEIANPKWRAQYNVSYTRDALNVLLQARYIGKGAFDIEADADAQDQFGVDDYWQINGAVGYEIGEHWNAQLSVNNLFDVDPPKYANASAAVYQYDLFGRYYTFTVRAHF